MMFMKNLFGSDRSSRNADLRSVQVCLEQSIFIFPGQRALRGPSEHSESNQRALAHSESTQKEHQRHTVGAYKYFVLLNLKTDLYISVINAK